MIRTTAIATGICATLTVGALAQGISPNDYTVVMLDNFYGMCLRPDFRSQDLKDFAREMGWPEAPTALMNTQRLMSGDAMDGWVAVGPKVDWLPDVEMPFIAMTTKTETAEVCGAFFRHAQGDFFVERFEEETGAVRLESKTMMGATEILYEIEDLPSAGIMIRTPRDGKDVQAFAVYPLR